MIILDVRVPCTPVARLNNHRACVNGIAWAPHSSCHICTSGKLVPGLSCTGIQHHITRIIHNKMFPNPEARDGMFVLLVFAKSKFVRLSCTCTVSIIRCVEQGEVN